MHSFSRTPQHNRSDCLLHSQDKGNLLLFSLVYAPKGKLGYSKDTLPQLFSRDVAEFRAYLF